MNNTKMDAVKRWLLVEEFKSIEDSGATIFARALYESLHNRNRGRCVVSKPKVPRG